MDTEFVTSSVVILVMGRDICTGKHGTGSHEKFAANLPTCRTAEFLQTQTIDGEYGVHRFFFFANYVYRLISGFFFPLRFKIISQK
jgi:hypothetical protein